LEKHPLPNHGQINATRDKYLVWESLLFRPLSEWL